MRDGPLVQVTDLSVAFGDKRVVDRVSFTLDRGETLALVGESGSGKSLTALSLLGLLPTGGTNPTGRIVLDGASMIGADPATLHKARGGLAGIVFQEPMTSLNPLHRIGRQVAEAITLHHTLPKNRLRERVIHTLTQAGFPDAERRLDAFPHQLSGGQRQRVMIATALANDPALLIADEPTTALDVTIQARILALLESLKQERGLALLLITHDLRIVRRFADRVCVMKDGAYVEEGPVEEIFAAPKTDYTRALLDAIPRLDRNDRGGRPTLAPLKPGAKVLVEGRDVRVHFPFHEGLFGKKRALRAVDGVDFEVREGETLGIVGESGSGKSTLARAVLNLIPATSGAVTLMGRDVTHAEREAMRAMRQDMQIVFQDPLASLDPRMTVGDSIAEPLRVFKPALDRAAREVEVRAMMDRVELDTGLINRYPHELSGGQNQRVGIARAMILRPKLVICDEAVSALDVSIRAQIIDLLINLQKEMGLSMIFISHDLAVVKEISHRVLVLYMGRVMELADRERIYTAPQHPYTKALMSAAPIPDPRIERTRKRIKLTGEPPSPMDPKAAFRFAPSRLPIDPNAPILSPELKEVAPGHLVSEFDPET